jgi:hypothetical protein
MKFNLRFMNRTAYIRPKETNFILFSSLLPLLEHKANFSVS